MRSCIFVTLVVLMGLPPVALPAPAIAGGGPMEVREALKRLEGESPGKIRATWQADRENLRSLRGALPGAFSFESSDEAARLFLRRNAALFRTDSALSDLAIESTRRSAAGHHVRFAQTYGGLPVFNGGMEVHVSRDARVFLVTSARRPVKLLSTRPKLSAPGAAAIARKHFSRTLRAGAGKRGGIIAPPAGGVRFENAPEPRLGVFLSEKRAHLAFRIFLVTESPADARDYLIDAMSGKILEMRSLVHEVVVDGAGDVFDPNPVNTLDDGSLEDNGDADSILFDGAYFDRDLPDITRFLGFHYLIGPYVNVTDAIEAPRRFPGTLGHVTTRDGNFRFRRDEPEFEHVVCYYHIDRSQRYIQSLGFDDANNRRQRIDPHGLFGADNAHYIGFPIGAGWIAMGDGGVDDGEDADVILHEYGHALQDNQSTGKYSSFNLETGAQGEGFSDYWAASSTHEASVANGFDPACIGEWDATSFDNSDPPCIRRVDGTKHYPEDLEGEVHSDGEIWSSALWDLFNTLGKTTADTLILQSHFLVPFSPTFAEGAQAVLDADTQLFGGANEGAICAAFTERGIPVAGCPA